MNLGDTVELNTGEQVTITDYEYFDCGRCYCVRHENKSLSWVGESEISKNLTGDISSPNQFLVHGY